MTNTKKSKQDMPEEEAQKPLKDTPLLTHLVKNLTLILLLTQVDKIIIKRLLHCLKFRIETFQCNQRTILTLLKKTTTELRTVMGMRCLKNWMKFLKVMSMM